MKVSIISPFYHDNKMMMRVMKSVLKQDCNDIEHIIVDGGSGEETVTLLKEYEQKYKACGKALKWVSEKDRGIADAVNKGSAMSTGDLLIFMIDVYIDSHVISQIVEKMVSENADYCYGGLIYQQDGKIVRKWSGKPGNWRLGWMMATPTMCYKRSVWEMCGPYIEKYRTANDYDFQLKVMRNKSLKGASIPKPLVVYYAGGVSNGSLKNKWNSIVEEYQVLVDNHVKFAWFTNLCKIIIALCAYTFVSKKTVNLEDYE